MLAGAEPFTVATNWLARSEAALASRDEAALRSLFRADGHWRDVLALTWDIRTLSGADAIVPALKEVTALPSGFRTDPQRTAPRLVTRAGEKCIEALFRFETAQALGSGVVRLSGDDAKAWTLLTA